VQRLAMETGINSVARSGGRQRRLHDERASTSPAVAPKLFTQFQGLIYQESGIWLAEHKSALLAGRLARRLRELGLATMAEYYNLVVRHDQQHERTLMIDCIATNETQFFREPRHFEFLAQRVFPRLKEEAQAKQRLRHIRVWSSGCSTGEEPYSLAMVLLKHFPRDTGWTLEVFATDISTRVLEKARAAVFPIARAREIPMGFLHTFMLKGRDHQEGLIKVGEPARSIVRFSRMNLQADSCLFAGLFDLIFCRNVLIYFDHESKTRAVDRMLSHLCPTGLLFVGHSESLNQVSTRVKTIAPSVYAMAGGPSIAKTASSPAGAEAE
jgi:chemotaxis protein methyltransferase CheR